MDYNQNFNQSADGKPQGGIGMSVASMILGILALLLSCCIPYLPFVLALIGLILGGVALGKKTDGRGMAVAGLVCSIIALIPALIVAIGGAALISSAGMM